MTATIQRYTVPGAAAGRASSQATSIEQSRAVADVQAAVTVAQNCPRDMADATSEMEYVCARLSVAEQAFYRVQNRGTGPSVHLMRELARIWGNIDYGVKELARDDVKGESEVLATCWDMQKNTRSSRTFIVPHARMAAGARKQLDDLQDIYLNNQNVGARAVRECIETVLPKWFTERAQEVCRATLANGEGEPLPERIQKMVTWFRDKLGVSQAQLEAHVERKRGQWTPDDVAQLKIAAKSIESREVSRDELFPPIVADVLEDEDQGAAPPKIASKVKSVKRSQAETRAADEADPEPDDDKPPQGDRIYREPGQRAQAIDGESGDDTPQAQAAPAAPGAPTAKTPGQTDRVTAALNKANKKGAHQALADMIDGVLSKVDINDPDDVLLIANNILGTHFTDGNQLDLAQIKHVHDSLEAWKQLRTLKKKVDDIINAADVAKGEDA